MTEVIDWMLVVLPTLPCYDRSSIIINYQSSSIINHQSSAISHLPSVINQQSSVINDQSSAAVIFCHQSSIASHQS
jgi:hypothetical protein